MKSIYEEHENHNQKLYLHQLQPTSPRFVEIQFQEVVLKPKLLKACIPIRFGQCKPRAPLTIAVKSTPLQLLQIELDQPIVCNKHLPSLILKENYFYPFRDNH
ncbi:unnamed protein product [Rotaria sordida]|uniref:Uncharacterized protein n=1 Tax=Rotaria sordida TaxID=392033 RepID=A0A815NYE2_9BILA|nr:unnamed protein product [Rotaria sordida]CAF4060340.1 unnamed protein product [Rotaria sordida]